MVVYVILLMTTFLISDGTLSMSFEYLVLKAREFSKDLLKRNAKREHKACQALQIQRHAQLKFHALVLVCAQNIQAVTKL